MVDLYLHMYITSLSNDASYRICFIIQKVYKRHLFIHLIGEIRHALMNITYIPISTNVSMQGRTNFYQLIILRIIHFLLFLGIIKQNTLIFYQNTKSKHHESIHNHYIFQGYYRFCIIRLINSSFYVCLIFIAGNKIIG